MPNQCGPADMEPSAQKFRTMACNANWTDASGSCDGLDVKFTFSSKFMDDLKTMDVPVGLTIIKYLFFTLLGLGVVGTIIELTHIGDIPDLDYKRLEPAARFKTIKQYEPLLIQRKRPWAQIALCFSALRNFMHLSYQSRGY